MVSEEEQEDIFAKIPQNIVNILKSKGIKDLYPPQKEALKYGLNNENIIVSIPTASGKTLIAEIIMLKRLLEFKENRKNKKALYLCPLKALASEKYNEFKEKWSSLGLKIGFSAGDLDSYDYSLFKNDIIITTNEKADSLIRNKPEYIDLIGVLVVDEIHLINDETRGITLEILLTRIKSINEDIQIVGLSATISNANDLAEWLSAKLIQSNWRPIKLKEGYFQDNLIYYSNGEIKEINSTSNTPLLALVEDVIKDGGQCLVFANSRERSRNYAKKIAEFLKSKLSKNELSKLAQLAKEFKNLSTSEELSKDARELIINISRGVAFHNAGLKEEERKFIEDHFRKGELKVLTATPTLAAGVNTPARRVVISSLYRYDSSLGSMALIPVMEYKQMAGRAGRPAFDPYGDSIIINIKKNQLKNILKKYIFGRTEEIISKLNQIYLLESHILGYIVMLKEATQSDLLNFLNNTLLAYQLRNKIVEFTALGQMINLRSASKDYNNDPKIDRLTREIELRNKLKNSRRNSGKGKDPLNLPEFDTNFISALELQDLNEYEDETLKNDLYNYDQSSNEQIPLNDEQLFDKLNKILKNTLTSLEDYEFIDINEVVSANEKITRFSPTKAGVIISKLYLKPKTAYTIFRRIKLLYDLEHDPRLRNTIQINEITLLYIISITDEYYINFNTKKDAPPVLAALRNFRKYLKMFTFEYDNEEDLELTDNMASLKITFILYNWIEELNQSDLLERYNIGAGDLQRLIETAQWLARGLVQLGKLLKYDKISTLTNDLNLRIKYGIKKELVPFVKLKGIGRVRARLLYSSGIFNIDNLMNTPDNELVKIRLFNLNLVQKIKNEIRKKYQKYKDIKYAPQDLDIPDVAAGDSEGLINHNASEENDYIDIDNNEIDLIPDINQSSIGERVPKKTKSKTKSAKKTKSSKNTKKSSKKTKKTKKSIQGTLPI